MPRLLSGITFVGFLTLLIFGFPMMKHDGMMEDNPCMASSFANSPCSTSPSAMAAHHLSAYQNFFHALSQPLLLSLVFVFALSLFPFFRSFIARRIISETSFFHTIRLRLRQMDHFARLFLRTWFQILEKRDPAHSLEWCRFEFSRA